MVFTRWQMWTFKKEQQQFSVCLQSALWVFIHFGLVKLTKCIPVWRSECILTELMSIKWWAIWVSLGGVSAGTLPAASKVLPELQPGKMKETRPWCCIVNFQTWKVFFFGSAPKSFHLLCPFSARQGLDSNDILRHFSKKAASWFI